MADRIITAEAVLKARDDGASDVLAKIAGNIDKVAKQAAHTAEVQGMGKALAGLASELAAVEKAAAAEAGLKRMQTRAAEAAANVDKLKAATAGVVTPSQEMARALSAAETAATKAAAAATKQAVAVRDAREALSAFGRPIADLASEQARLKRATEDATHALTLQMTAEREAAGVARKLGGAEHAAGRHGGHGGGFDFGGAVAGVVAAHSYIGGMERVLETYREFDKEVRYGRLVMGLTPEQQKPLVDQAIHGGATSRYNDIQWLETQRELAARGYGKDQVLAFAPVAARIGQAFDTTMPEAVKALEGSLLGFHKDTSTMAAAMAAAERTADMQVKAAKIGGFQFEDVTQLLKYGAAPARMAHLSEESLYSFGVIGRKSNMGGDESGVAFRALVSNLLSPTAGAKTAMLAAGIDYSKYQKAPKAIDLGAFTRDVAMKYGVQLNEASRAGLARIFSDPKMLGDPARFVPAVTHMLKETLGKQDAKSSKAIAKDARAFRDDSTGGVDANRLMLDIMEHISKSPQLANAIFGAKQGGRIYATLGDPKLYAHILEEVTNESKGFAQKVSDGRMDGFNGAVSELQGSIKNLESAIGRAIDNNGQGGFFTITNATKLLGEFTQDLAEADPKILEFGTIVAGAGAMFGAVKLAGWFTGANALKGSAGLLDKAALHLMEVGVGPGGRANPLAKVPPVAPLGGVPELAIPGGVTLGAGALFLGGAAIATEIVKKSLEAQQAGHHGLWAAATLATEREDRQDVAELQAERAEVAKRIADQKAREKLPGTADVATSADRARLDQLDAAIDNKIRSLDALHPNTQPRTAPLPVARPAQPPAFHPDDRRDRAEPYVRPETPMNREQTFRFMQGLGMLPSGWQMEQQGPSRPAAPFAPFAMVPADRADRMRERDDAIRAFQQELLDAAPVMGQLDRQTGLILTSFDGLNGGAGTLNMSFGTLGTGVGGAAHELDVLALAARTASMAFASVLQAVGSGGGNGITNASWGGGAPDLSGADRTGGPAIGHFYSAAEREKNIRTYAASIGGDSRVAMAVARSEGFGRFDGDHGTSFGDFQMHIGGGLGDLYRRTTGKDPRDPKNELDLDRFALDQAKRGGWGPWHGAARIGVHGHYGFGRRPVAEEHPAFGAPLSRHHGAPDAAGPGTTARLDHVTAKLERVASAVERGGLVRVEVHDRERRTKIGYSRGARGHTTA